ncbi:unnamed protein product [Auanema sp. JU1783]|nr:unnamed protein product [Auanema sp. JU1783]
MKFLSCCVISILFSLGVLAVNDPKSSSTVTTVSTTITSTTGASTTTEVCADQTDCSKDVSLCTNPAYQSMMHNICKKTCGYCDGTATGSPCVDSIGSCEQWEKKGFCENPFYSDETKKKDCAKTCGLCDK